MESLWSESVKERIASDALIYAHHADNHAPTQKAGTHLLFKLAAMNPSFSYSKAPRRSFLQLATIFSLTGYVEDHLSTQEMEIQDTPLKLY